MSKRGNYLGGHTVIRARAPTSLGKKKYVGLLNDLPTYNASVGPTQPPPKAGVRQKKSPPGGPSGA